MKYALALISTVALVGCLTPSRFDTKFEAKYCEEWQACNSDFACDLPELDYSDCDFDRQAAKDCLDGQWVCDNSNSAFPRIVQPDACQAAYVCNLGGTTGSGTPTTDTGVTTSTGSTSR